MKETIWMLVAIMSVAVLLVNLTVQLVKDLPIFKKVPTNFVVLLVSQIIVNLGTYAYLDNQNFSIFWYYIPIIIMAGLIVSYLAMYGWEKFISLWEDSKYPK